MLLSKMWTNFWLRLWSGSWLPFYVYQGREIMVEPWVSRIVVRASDLWGIFNKFCIIVVGTKNFLNWSQLNKANHKNAYSIQFWSYVINYFMHHHTTLKLKICSTKTTFKSIIVLFEKYIFLLSLHNYKRCGPLVSLPQKLSVQFSYGSPNNT